MNYYDYITEFVFREDQPDQADYIVIPGSGYGEMALRAARLYHEGYAHKIVATGRHTILADCFTGVRSPEKYVGTVYDTESDFLARVLQDEGVSDEDIIRERNSTFTYENAVYTRKLLEDMADPSGPGEMPESYHEEYPCNLKGFRRIGCRRIILVCQAFHARRSLMYFQLVFPEVEFLVCPVVTREISRDNWFLDEKKIGVVMGEVERCGTQFADIFRGKDRVWEDIHGAGKEVR